jgi:hypothetical protein
MNVPLNDELLIIEGETSFLLVGKATRTFVLCIETTTEEFCQTVEPEDFVVVSAPEGGSIDQARMLLELIRKYHMPLVVLPKGHPGSRRLKMVVSVGPEVLLSCGIQRGTHPEQHVICSSDELAGMHILGVKGGVEITSAQQDITIRYLAEKQSGR